MSNPQRRDGDSADTTVPRRLSATAQERKTGGKDAVPRALPVHGATHASGGGSCYRSWAGVPPPPPTSTGEAAPDTPTGVESPVVVLPRVSASSKGAGKAKFVLPGRSRGSHDIRMLNLPAQAAKPSTCSESEVGDGQLVIGGGATSHAGGECAARGAPHELAVVPFTPPHRAKSSTDDAAAPRALIGAVDSSQWALTTRRVCPTCLRPYRDDEDDRSEEGDDPLLDSDDDSLAKGGSGEGSADGGARRGSSSTHKRRGRAPRRRRTHSRSGHGSALPPTSVRRMLSPQYFRALEGAMPLAIGDGSNDRLPSPDASNPPFESGVVAGITPSPSQQPRHNASSTPAHTTQSLINYVSPTGVSPDADVYGGFSDGVAVDPVHPLGVEWAGDDTANPPDVRTTIPYRTTLSSDAEVAPRGSVEELKEEDKDARTSAAQRERARLDNEGDKGRSPLIGSNGYYARYFVEVQKLGSGTYGGVYLCQHVMEGVPLGTFALKKVPVGDNAAYLQKVLSEVRILEEVKRHPNVVEYNHSWVEEAQLADFGPPVRCLFILMEFATEGSLDAYLERYGTALSTVAVWYFFLSAVAGTAHLHQKNILHRDLKPQNLLLTGPVGKPPRVLVSDFGTAALLGENAYDRTGGTGTLEYMAPELMEVVPNLSTERYVNHHTKASDVWSLGMILYYLACNATLPTHLPNGSVALGDIQSRAPFPRPPEMVELIRAMLQRDPRRRPSCHHILSSTVVQTILRSFNSAAAAGASGAGDDSAGIITRDIMPCDDRVGSPSPPHLDSPNAGRRWPTGGNEESIDLSNEDEAEDPVGPGSANNNSSSAGVSRDDHLQSSRVDHMSTTMNANPQNPMEVPLLMQYRANDAARLPRIPSSGGRTASTSPQGSPLPPFARPSQMKRASSPDAALPAAKRPRMVDAEVQTDPVHIVD